MEEEILTFNEAKKFLKLSKPTLIKLIHEREDFPAIKIGGQWRFLKGDLIQWLQNNSNCKKSVRLNE